MKIPASARRSTPDTLIIVEKLVINRLAKSMIEIIPKTRQRTATNARIVVDRQFEQFFIRFLPFQPDVARLIIAKRSAKQAINIAHNQI